MARRAQSVPVQRCPPAPPPELRCGCAGWGFRARRLSPSRSRPGCGRPPFSAAFSWTEPLPFPLPFHRLSTALPPPFPLALPLDPSHRPLPAGADPREGDRAHAAGPALRDQVRPTPKKHAHTHNKTNKQTTTDNNKQTRPAHPLKHNLLLLLPCVLEHPPEWEGLGGLRCDGRRCLSLSLSCTVD